ncbi:MAG: hypothetical protein SRB2_02223 [Desulfobacteraceae bacterium Eth-SRB2]|nr:MAG: hypothetical protein SRB2_02223 [Desulfobacteraceae bacterium Eth-SRB2]
MIPKRNLKDFMALIFQGRRQQYAHLLITEIVTSGHKNEKAEPISKTLPFTNRFTHYIPGSASNIILSDEPLS